MSLNKKFLEAVSKDPALKAEIDEATIKALGEFLKSKGLAEEAGKIVAPVLEKIAEAHGFKADAMEEVNDDELEAVAGGIYVCPTIGIGSVTAKQCFCAISGNGTNDSGKQCRCPYVGMGADD